MMGVTSEEKDRGWSDVSMQGKCRSYKVRFGG